MAKGLNQVEVGMRFTADTQAAKAAIQQLQNSLNSLTKGTALNHGSFGFSKEIQQATKAAAQLQVQLQSAINVDTGKLDLGKFSDNLRKSKMSLSDYQKSLSALGAEGKQAFSQLANSVLQAEIPLRRSNALLTELWTTMKNTARWQLSSSVLHGFMGAVQEAYGYAKDLNESLNNIRIVTGHSVEEMGRFAGQANKAAKALSSTTTEYTNAALIYYQQGLGDAEIEERTAITLKMANVARQSAEVVSDQMTAVWNNFDDGSKSLEYYADVMTALGAATASSTDEIAAGLEKFSAVAGTVGLSYEYATAALATVTAETRQSADVVGTAFKTLFARIEGLKLGDTLEDGTDLNKYSEALSKVGVQIKDLATGEMKSMDQILEDLGARWQTLAQDEKIALAQTVAGVRQYNQLISLMDNWDTFQENLGTAYGSSGALEEQAEIYAESWEAARDRVTAAAESIYQSLIDDKFFIGLNNGLAEVLENIEQLIKSFGGLPGVLSLVGSLMFKIFNQNLTSSLENLIYNIKMSTTAGRESIKQLRQDAAQSLIKGTKADGKMTTSESNASLAYQSQGEAQQLLLDNAERLTEEQKEQYQILLDSHNALVQQSVQHGIELEQAQRQTEILERRSDAYAQSLVFQAKLNDEEGEHTKEIEDAAASYELNKTRLKETLNLFYELSTFHESEGMEFITDNELNKLKEATNIFRGLSKEELTQKLGTDTAADSMLKLFEEMESEKVTTETLKAAMVDFEAAGETAAVRLKEAFMALNVPEKEAEKRAQALVNQYLDLGDKTAIVTEDNQRLANSFQLLKDMISSTPPKIQSLSSALVSGANIISNVSMLLNSLKGIVDTLNNQDMSFGEKFFTIFTQIGFILPTIISTVGQITTLMGPTGFIGAMLSSTNALNQYNAALTAQSFITDKENGKSMLRISLNGKQVTTINALTAATNKETIAELAQRIIKEGNLKNVKEKNIVDAIQLFLTQQQTKATIKQTAADLAHKAVLALKNPYVLAAAAAMVALTIAIYSVVKAYNKAQAQTPEAQFKRAEEAAARAKEEFNEAKSAYEDLMTTIDKHKSAQDQIDNMTSGTIEWKMAIMEANQEALNLINTYGLLQGTDYSINSGRVIINQSGYDDIEQQQFSDYMQAYRNQIVAEEATNKASYNKALSEITEYTYAKNYVEDTGDEEKDQQMERFTRAVLASQSSPNSYSEAAAQTIGGAISEATGNVNMAEKNAELAIGVENYSSAAIENLVDAIQEGEITDLTSYLNDVASGTITEPVQGLTAEMAKGLAASEDLQDKILDLSSIELNLIDTNKALESALIMSANPDSKFLKDNEDQGIISEVAGYDTATTNKNIKKAKSDLSKQTESTQWDTIFKTLYGEDYADNYKIENIKDGQASVYKKNEDGGWDPITEEEGGSYLSEYTDRYLGIKGAERTDEQFQKYSSMINNNREDFSQLSEDEEIVNQIVAAYRSSRGQGLTELDMSKINIEDLIADDSFKWEKFNEWFGTKDIAGTYGTSSGKQTGLTSITKDDYLKEYYVEEARTAYEREMAALGKDFSYDTITETEKAYEAKGEKEKQLVSDLYNTDTIKDTEAIITKGMSEDQIAEYNEEVSDLTDEIQRMAEEGKDVQKVLKDDAKAAKVLATAAKQTEKGLDKLTDNFEDWKEAIESKDIVRSTKAMNQMKDSLADVMGVSDELDKLGIGLGEHFGEYLTENMDTVEKAANGDRDAILELQKVAAEDILIQLGYDPEADTEIFDAVSSLMDSIQSKLDSGDLKFGAVDDTALLNSLSSIINSVATTTDEAEALLAGMGFDAEVVVDPNAAETVTTHSYETLDVTEDKHGYPIVKPGATLERKDTKQTAATGMKIKTANYVGGGNINTVKGGTGRGGGGGGGSKSKPAEKVKRTRKSDVVDRYKEINDALDDMADAIDKASGKADRLYGKARIKAMKDQAKLMRDEIDLMKKKRNEAKSYLDQDKKALNKKAKEYGISFSYDDKGNITDYTNEMTKLYNQLAAAENTMAGMSTKEAQDEYKEKTLEPIQDKIDELTELIEAYEETRELIEDLDKDIREGEWAAEDLEFEAFEYEIELKIEIDDRDLEYLEYLLGKIEDKAFAAGERISLITQQTDEIISKSKTTREAISTILGDNLSKEDKKLFYDGKIDQIDWQSYVDNETFTEAEVEALKEYANELLAYNEELFAMQDQVHEELQNSFAEWNEEIEKGIALFDHYDSVVDHLQNITDLTQGLTGYNAELNRTLAETKTQLASDRAASYAVDYENQKAVVDEMRSKIYDANGKETEWFTKLSEDEQAKWLEDLEVAEESVRQAEENLFASTSEAIQAAIDEFETAFTSSLKEMELALAGEGGFAAWNIELERQQDISERTLKAYQETYELSKLNRQIINSINDTDNVKAKQALLEIQEEIYQYQKDGKEMSQYELDYLQKKYELRLAEIALEEAQNAKSQVRMSRDSEGNWGYVYTADEDKVAEAEQNYEDKLYEITNLTQEYQDQVSANIIQTYQEFNDAMQEIYDRNAEGLYSSEEEFLNAIAEIQAFYQGKLDFQYEQLDIATANSKALYEDDWTSYQFSTNAKINSNKGFQNSFNDTMVGVATGYQNSEKALSEFSGKVGTVNPETGEGSGLLGGIAKAYDNMETSINKNLGNISKALGMEEGASLDLKNFAKNAKKYLVGEEGDKSTSVKESSKKVYDQIKTDSNNIKKILIGKDGLLDSVATFSEKWTKELDKIIKKNEKLIKSINDLNKKLTTTEPSKDPDSPKNPDPPKNPEGGGGKTTQGDGKVQKGDKVKVKKGTKWYYDSYGTAPTGTAKNGTIKYINEKGSHPYNIDGLGWVKKSDISGYDTGGYTGIWGKEGKLAFLHQKELVLNPDDTQNFLLAMNVLREITKAITLQSIIPDASKFNFGGNNIVEQDVTIHAEFPNVTDHNEIEMALSNLVNTASQYANRK